jgi:hypothetical protein
MSKKDFTETLQANTPQMGGINSLLGEPMQPGKTINPDFTDYTDYKKGKGGRPRKPENEKVKPGQTKEGEQRVTYILPSAIIDYIKEIANYEGVQIKEVVLTAITNYLKEYKPTKKQQPKITDL